MRFQRAVSVRTVRPASPRRIGGWWPRLPPPPEPDEEDHNAAELVPAPSAPSIPGWGPLTRMGPQLRVQARRGFRAVVVELDPGLYLVAEIPEAVLRPTFGAWPLLGKLLAKAAKRALSRSETPESTEPEPPSLPALRWAPTEAIEAVSGCACPHCGRP